MQKMLHRKKLLDRVEHAARSGKALLITADDAGRGRTFVLNHVARALQLSGRAPFVLRVFGARTKSQVAARLYDGLFSPHCAASEHTARFVASGERDKLLSVENALRELSLRFAFVVIVDDLHALDLAALEALARVRMPNVGFVASCCTAQRLSKHARAFVHGLNPDLVPLSALNDTSIGTLFDELCCEKGLSDKRWTASRRRIIKAAVGNPGTLCRVVEALRQEKGEQAFHQRLNELSRLSVRYIAFEKLRLVLCSALFIVAFVMHTTTSSAYKSIAAVVLTSLAIVAFRFLRPSTQARGNPLE